MIGRALPAAILGLQLAVAFGVGNLYPFSTFEMYGGTRLTSASRIGVRVGDQVVEIREFSRWRCQAPPDPSPQACPREWPMQHIEAIDREAVAWIAAAGDPGADGVPVEVVRRIWRWESDDGRASVSDCVLARCEAAP